MMIVRCLKPRKLGKEIGIAHTAHAESKALVASEAELEVR